MAAENLGLGSNGTLIGQNLEYETALKFVYFFVFPLAVASNGADSKYFCRPVETSVGGHSQRNKKKGSNLSMAWRVSCYC